MTSKIWVKSVDRDWRASVAILCGILGVLATILSFYYSVDFAKTNESSIREAAANLAVTITILSGAYIVWISATMSRVRIASTLLDIVAIFALYAIQVYLFAMLFEIYGAIGINDLNGPSSKSDLIRMSLSNFIQKDDLFVKPTVNSIGISLTQNILGYLSIPVFISMFSSFIESVKELNPKTDGRMGSVDLVE